MPRLLPLIVVMVLASSANAAIQHGRVDRVIDGDTLAVITQNEVLRIRIKGIDAPESKQDFGMKAKEALKQIALGQSVILDVDDEDQYGRRLASVAVNGTDVGLYMLEHGFAWFYSDYGSQLPGKWRNAYRAAEVDARSNGVGLWGSTGPIPPWTWRKQRREAAQAAEEEQRDTLEGISAEMENDFQSLESNINNLKRSLLSEDEANDDSKLEPKQRLSWWEIFSKLGEGASRWLKAFFESLF
ncbi:thermonuclease family protein [Sutterella sp.]|uniref:thermonuclease family protein n=1 Tax=Sutterella sp. TaxID=1981025 RepID=UPI003FD8DA8D